MRCNPHKACVLQNICFNCFLTKTSNHASTQGTLHGLNCIGHSTPVVEFLAQFTDMQYETVAKDDVDYVLHYVLDYVLCTLFSPKYEILGVRINDKDLSAKSRHMLCVSSPEWDNQGKHFNFRWICLTNFVFRFREILWCTCYVMLCGKPLHEAWGIFLVIIWKLRSEHKTYSNCDFTGLPTLYSSDVRLSHMIVFNKIRLITKIAFIQVWWCLTYSLLSLYSSTYEAVPDAINIVREVMRVILPSIMSRQLTNVSIPCLFLNNTVRSSRTTQLIFCLKRCPAAFKRFARSPGLLLSWSS